MKITVIGTGYVGLVTGTCFSETGVDVTCIDTDANKIELLSRGVVPIYEPGLEDMVDRNVLKGRLSFATSLREPLNGCEVVFIGVGTPPGEDGSADLKHVLKAAAEIGEYMNDYLVVVTKSTVPVGTAERVREVIKEKLFLRGKKIEFDMASNPEFLKEGSAINDFLRPERIVIGIDSERAEGIMKKLYKPFLLNNHPILFMDIPSAELTKYAANSMLASRISFINEIANLCDLLGADINQVRRGIGSDSRIGSKFLYAGVGYGGSCFPKDVKALIKTAEERGMKMEILTAVEKVNNKQKSVLFNKIYNHFNGDLEGKTFRRMGTGLQATNR